MRSPINRRYMNASYILAVSSCGHCAGGRSRRAWPRPSIRAVTAGWRRRP